MAEYRRSAHAVFDLKYQLVWITKYRYKVLRGRVAERTRDLIRQSCEAREVVIIRGGELSHQITSTCWCRRQRIWRRGRWCNSSRGVRREDCRRSFQNCARSIGGSTCGREATSARRWARSMKQRSKPISKTRSGTKTIKGSKSQRPRSLQPALSRGRLQAASAALPTFSRTRFYRL